MTYKDNEFEQIDSEPRGSLRKTAIREFMKVRVENNLGSLGLRKLPACIGWLPGPNTMPTVRKPGRE